MTKGGAFEREQAKLWSLWWTGDERDDIFWRTSQSGGRATTRTKAGRRTHGQYGDLAAVDPSGESLLRVVTIELKTGYKSGSPWHAMDNPNWSTCQWEKFVQQAQRSREEAGTPHWLLVHRMKNRLPVVYLPKRLVDLVSGYGDDDFLRSRPCAYICLDQTVEHDPIFAIYQDAFFNSVTPNAFIEIDRVINKRQHNRLPRKPIRLRRRKS